MERCRPAPLGSTELFRRLEALGIAHTSCEHSPVYTVAQAEALRGEFPGASVKNLFLRDKKRRFWLLVAAAATEVSLKALRGRIDSSGSLSFASPEHLSRLLGVEPGAVTPLAVINDRAGEVTVLIDRALLAHPQLGLHPLRCDMTTTLATSDLLRFSEAEDHPPTLVDL